MGDAEYWRDLKIAAREKRKAKQALGVEALAKLLEHFPDAKKLNDNPVHYRVKTWYYWPTTGLAINAISKKRIYGIKKLLKELEIDNGEE